MFGPENLLLSGNTQVSIDTNYNSAHPTYKGSAVLYYFFSFYVGLALASTVYPPPPKKKKKKKNGSNIQGMPEKIYSKFYHHPLP